MFGWTAAFIHNHLCITCYLRVRGFVIFVPLSVCCHYTSTFYNMWITSHKRTNKISFIYHVSCSLISKQFFKIFYLEKTISVESVKLSPPPHSSTSAFSLTIVLGEKFSYPELTLNIIICSVTWILPRQIMVMHRFYSHSIFQMAWYMYHGTNIFCSNIE